MSQCKQTFARLFNRAHTGNRNGAFGLCFKLRESVANIEPGVVNAEVKACSTRLARVDNCGKAHLVKAQGVNAACESGRSVGAIGASAILGELCSEKGAGLAGAQSVVGHNRHCSREGKEQSARNDEQCA